MNEEEADFEIESTKNIPENMSEHEIGYNTDLVNLDNDTASLEWDTYLTHELFTTFNLCIQNSYDIPDHLYKVYKEFKLNKSSHTKDILEMDVPMSNENTDLPIPILNETIVQSNPMPNEITGQSSYFTNETPSHYNQMPNEAIVHPILTPIQSCTKDLANDSDNDILSYPKIYAIKSKENRRKAQKYFVLTSQEAMQSKLNDEQKKKNSHSN